MTESHTVLSGFVRKQNPIVLETEDGDVTIHGETPNNLEIGSEACVRCKPVPHGDLVRLEITTIIDTI